MINECTVMTSDGASLHSESFGSPDDPPLLLIMGATASGRWWPDEFCRQIASRGRFVIRYDHRDTGASTRYPVGQPGYSLHDLARDALAVLDHYGISESHIAGMSLGGYLAQILALTNPERVASITLIASEPLASHDPQIPPLDPEVLEYHLGAGTVDWGDRNSVIAFETGLWRLMTGPERTFDPEAVEAISGEDFDRSGNCLSKFNHALIEADPDEIGRVVDRLGEIRVPVLIVHGSDDLVLRHAHAVRSNRMMPHSRLLTLQRAGHELNRQDWPAIVDAIIETTDPA
jgi:pimeloyl-ACP methyl ester carboxylesterase